ncbi:uncharacterized protein FOBCDRAFT_243204 [Fusarium oxysporum Fo47]|uniref:uncharacterized protein n=1 Tax=Fusarium oxysporum Fo47 TaxID=660027 RepID=UPI002869D5C8|nr:uncharacterized protein FOBCDRAFT_243204 [Fusarium oxysporum Fo47]QKD59224.2 hypothetical protein FOBCDRAFT_243204 [Fusarium oxysporum Fo47]
MCRVAQDASIRLGENSDSTARDGKSNAMEKFRVNTNPQSPLEGGAGASSTALANFNDPTSTRETQTTYNETPRNNPAFPVASTSQSAGNSPSYPSSPWQQATGRSPTDLPSNSSAYTVTHDASSPYGPPQDHVPSPRSHQPYSSGESTKFPLEDPQEACLLRYFVEELSHWGILYQGQLLPKLTPHDAVEYTLKCIPALRDFHLIQDDEKLESIIATAVILRQLEEIDDEEDQEQERNQRRNAKPQVNFLAIIDAVLRSPPSRTLFGRRSLIQAAYWMAVRQELYHSFTKRHPPKMILDPEYGHGASKANKIVLHTAQVAKWRWADGSEQEWLRLQKQGEVLEEEALKEYQPFYVRPADRSNGEIFPIIWYSSALEVTTMQLSIIAKMVLMAENPFLGGNSSTRAQWREIENQVRQMILDLCGISLCHPGCPPALVHAAFGMELYGDFFTDRYERRALRGVVDKFRDARAWPVQNLSKMFE